MASDIGLVIHGTTLATNALIERKGARTALVTTDGFRDSIEIAYENRFEQYDIFMNKPPPLVPRELRFGVKERMDARGNVLIPLDLSSVDDVIDVLRREKIEAVAIGSSYCRIAIAADASIGGSTSTRKPEHRGAA